MKKIQIRPSFLIPVFLLFWNCPWKEVLLFLLAALLHEGGHLAAIRLFRYRVKKVTLSLTGACMELTSPYVPYRREILISLSGPLGNALFCAAAFILLRFHFTREGVLFFFFNFLFMFLNLLPIRGLDGEIALRGILCLRTDLERAERILSFLGAGFSCLLFLLSLFLLFREKNISLFLLWGSLALDAPCRAKKATASP